ncbi:hypothetical protein CFC21_099838 [Triticum aestivum]|uniref:KIB1-4 beta-propeller domain-containing protein n=2 Tax=Triticum aestivum TaxID=4565 RepID=A0A3B6RQM5_WHEAT|nr:hypothetical protein CFC21_099838 [Triticum aestivum]
MNIPGKLLVTSVSKHLDVATLQGWAYLPDCLLHSIVAMLHSSLDLVAFAATCRSWRVAFFAYPSKSAFRTLCPPLLVRQNLGIQTPISGPHNRHTLKFIDPSNPKINRHCRIREEILLEFRYAGSSYGHLIFFHNKDCLVVDAFSGAEVSPPRLPSVTELYYCSTLTGPLASPNSHLLVSTESSLFDWLVGSDSWSELKFSNVPIKQIVELDGQFIAMDDHMKIYTLQLAPKLVLQELPAEWCHGKTPRQCLKPWLVVCHDMLLMGCYDLRFPFQRSAFCTLHLLDMSINPAKWMEMKKLNNWALFVAADTRDPPFSCINPERWGGRSNCLYYTQGSQPWGVRWLCNEPDLAKDPSTGRDLMFTRNMLRQLQSLWVYPSMFYSNGQ